MPSETSTSFAIRRSTRMPRTSAIRAMMPPSPWLWARMISVTYLSETISVTAQNTSEITPYTLACSGRTARSSNVKTVCSAYSGLVPMSPKTIPSAASVIAVRPLPDGERGSPSSSSADRGGAVETSGAPMPGLIPSGDTRSIHPLDAIHPQQPLLVLGLDARHDLDVLLEARAAELAAQQRVDLEDPGRVVHLDLDPDRPRLALHDADLVDRGGRQRVDVGEVRLQRRARAAVLHVERVGHAHDARLERERAPGAAVADDRVQDLRGDD